MTYAQIIPCSGWVYIIDNQKVEHDVAAWALKTDGSVIGLIAGGSDAKDNDGDCQLVKPPGRGIYKLKGK